MPVNPYATPTCQPSEPVSNASDVVTELDELRAFIGDTQWDLRWIKNADKLGWAGGILSALFCVFLFPIWCVYRKMYRDLLIAYVGVVVLSLATIAFCALTGLWQHVGVMLLFLLLGLQLLLVLDAGPDSMFRRFLRKRILQLRRKHGQSPSYLYIVRTAGGTRPLLAIVYGFAHVAFTYAAIMWLFAFSQAVNRS